MEPIKVEIGQFRPVDKGALRAFFSLIIYPQGQKILDCRYFVQDDKRWFSFPQKEIPSRDNGKSEYIPLVSYVNKEYLEELKTAVLNALKDAKPMEKNGQAIGKTYQGKANKLPSQSPASWQEPPF